MSLSPEETITLRKNIALDKGKARADAACRAIQTLRDTPAFNTYFLPRLREELDKIDVGILAGMVPRDYDVAIALRKEYVKILNLLDTDEAGHTKLSRAVAAKENI